MNSPSREACFRDHFSLSLNLHRDSSIPQNLVSVTRLRSLSPEEHFDLFPFIGIMSLYLV
jgi:hypothetical protein